jgi:hypothetical protein
MVAEDVGTLAKIDKTDIKAFLVCREHNKIGKVLVENK